MNRRALAVAAASLLLPLAAAPAPAGDTGLALETFAFISDRTPITVTHAPDDSLDRVFVVEREGRISQFDRATAAELGDFLTIPGVDTQGEGGLLALAFHPDYQTNGHFFVFYTVPSAPLRIVVERYTRSAGDPLTADPATALTVFELEQFSPFHNGGWLGFGPDGHLYVTLGDDDFPPANGQDLATLKGKILRLDINADDFPADATRNYAIPADNPFVGTPGAREEIFHYGLRNPYRCAFDRLTGDFYISDVGSATREEINILPAGTPGGVNFGWPCLEGNSCHDPACCNDPGFTGPLFDYTHADGCSVIGGVVYRGCAIPSLDGAYLFSDFCAQAVWSFRYDNGTITDNSFPDSIVPGAFGAIGYGEDALGEVYTCVLFGIISKIVPAEPPLDDDGNGIPDICETGACPGDCDGNSTVDFNDLVTMLFDFGTPGSSPSCDADESGTVDFNDLVTALFLFGPCV